MKTTFSWVVIEQNLSRSGQQQANKIAPHMTKIWDVAESQVRRTKKRSQKPLKYLTLEEYGVLSCYVKPWPAATQKKIVLYAPSFHKSTLINGHQIW